MTERNTETKHGLNMTRCDNEMNESKTQCNQVKMERTHQNRMKPENKNEENKQKLIY